MYNEKDNKIWLLSFPHRSLGSNKLSDLMENQSNFSDHGEIISLASHGMVNPKGFRASFLSNKDPLRFKIFSNELDLTYERSFSKLSCL